MNRLKTLDFCGGTLSIASVDKFVALLQSYKRNLLPSLKGLKLSCFFSDAVDSKRFFEAVGKNKAFASLKSLDFASGNEVNIDILAPAFGGGAFAAIECLQLRGLNDDDDGLTKLCHALEGNPCTDTLKELCLKKCKVNGNGMAA